MATRNIRVEGVVVGRKNWGELDKIIVIFTKTQGKIRLLAKGIRRINSRRLGALELGNQVKVLIYQNRNFDIISEVEVIDDFDDRENSIRLGGIIFLCELINALLPEKEINPEIYQEFLKTRSLIKAGKIKALVFFEARLLQMLGYGLDKEILAMLKANRLKLAHKKMRQRIEAITESPLKSLAFFK